MFLFPSRADIFRQKTGADKGVVIFSYSGVNIEQVAVQLKF